MGEERDIALDGLTDVLTEKATSGSVTGRLLVGLAGPPGSGKSTCSEILNERLKRNEEAEIAVPVFDRSLDVNP